MYPRDGRPTIDDTDLRNISNEWLPLPPSPAYPPLPLDVTQRRDTQRRDNTLQRWPPFLPPNGIQTPTPVQNGEHETPLVIQSGAVWRVDRRPPVRKPARWEGLQQQTRLRTTVFELAMPALVGALIIMTTPAARSVPSSAPRHFNTHGELHLVTEQPATPIQPSTPAEHTPDAVTDAPTTAVHPAKPRRTTRRRLVAARKALRRRQWSRAAALASAILRARPGDRRARAVKRRARSQLRRYRHYLNGARRALKRGQWARARTFARAALRITPRDKQARRIKRAAERRLRQRRG